MNDLVARAEAFATKAHEGQKRKYTETPYIEHPAAVMELVASVPHTPEMLAAAWLHDVVEDCGVATSLIDMEFGPEVANLVGWLTDVSTPRDGNRATRKAIDRAHTAKAPPFAKTVKLAALIDNLWFTIEHDPEFYAYEFAAVYLVENAELLTMLRPGDSTLFLTACSDVRRVSVSRGLGDVVDNILQVAP